MKDADTDQVSENNIQVPRNVQQSLVGINIMNAKTKKLEVLDLEIKHKQDMDGASEGQQSAH